MKRIILFLLFAIVTIAAVPNYRDMNTQRATNIIARDSIFGKGFGDVPGHGLEDVFASNLDVDIAEGYDVVRSEGGDFTIATSAQVVNVVSTNAADDAGSTGATAIIIYGLDDDGLEIEETVVMDGTSNVATTNSFEFINRMAVVSSGSGNTNAGNITATQATSGIQMGYIKAGEAVSHTSAIRVPSNEQYRIRSAHLSTVRTAGGQNPKVRFQAVVYNFTTETEYIIFEDVLDAGVANYRIIKDFKAQNLLSNEIFYFKASSSHDNTEVYARALFETRETSE